MKKIASVCLMGLILAALSACKFGKLGNTVAGSGVRKTEKRDLPSFKAIEAEGAFDIQATCQKPVSFEIEADDNLLPLIQSDVKNGVLYLSSEKGYNSRRGVTVRITVPNLESIKATGAGKFHIQDLKNDKFELRSTGASAVTVSGETNNVEIHSTGAGVIDAHNLRAEKAKVSSSGAAKVDVYASEQLDASVSGIGQVSYSGDPKVVNKSVSGVGAISRREQTAN